jgi:hypothetical protein
MKIDRKDEPMPTTFEDEDVILYLLRRRRVTDAGEEHVIARTTFRRCRLLGPIHLRLRENAVLEDCEFEPSTEECIVTAEASAFYVGALGAIDCRFESCIFDNVKVVVPPGHPLIGS